MERVVDAITGQAQKEQQQVGISNVA
jgi:hypothetical protein